LCVKNIKHISSIRAVLFFISRDLRIKTCPSCFSQSRPGPFVFILYSFSLQPKWLRFTACPPLEGVQGEVVHCLHGRDESRPYRNGTPISSWTYLEPCALSPEPCALIHADHRHVALLLSNKIRVKIRFDFVQYVLIQTKGYV
jgi:hypothetical protein